MSDRVEQLLRSALVPIEPPEALSDRLERGLSELTEVAAAGGLVLVRARQQQKKRNATGLQALEKSIRGVADDIEKRLKR